MPCGQKRHPDGGCGPGAANQGWSAGGADDKDVDGAARRGAAALRWVVLTSIPDIKRYLRMLQM
jgi:hypothetical protein